MVSFYLMTVGRGKSLPPINTRKVRIAVWSEAKLSSDQQGTAEDRERTHISKTSYEFHAHMRGNVFTSHFSTWVS